MFEDMSLDQDVDLDQAFVPSAPTYGSTTWASTEPVPLSGHTAFSTSTFYSVPKERPKRFVHANLLDVINPNESDFSADEKSREKVSGDSSDEGDAIQTEVEEAEEEVATSTDAPPVDRILQNMKRRYTWVKKDFDIEAGSFENNFPLPPAQPLSAVEYFDMFVSRSMLKAVVDESNKYYFQKHGATLNLTVKELTAVLGMFFRMGLVNMHRRCNKGFYGSQGGYQLGLGAGVVLQLCSSLRKRDDNLVVADNFFTGPQLVEKLSRMGISYIGVTSASFVASEAAETTVPPFAGVVCPLMVWSSLTSTVYVRSWLRAVV
ncbi:hypothetical protein MRX96_057792 [Rhipicephalus microplus]